MVSGVHLEEGSRIRRDNVRKFLYLEGLDEQSGVNVGLLHRFLGNIVVLRNNSILGINQLLEAVDKNGINAFMELLLLAFDPLVKSLLLSVFFIFFRDFIHTSRTSYSLLFEPWVILFWNSYDQ